MKKHLLSIALFFIFSVTSLIIGQTANNDFDFIVVSPETISGSYEWGGTTDFGPGVTDNFCGELVWGGEAETLGCDPITADLTGKIALIRRGTCDFSLKIFNAQEAGAIAVVVVGHDQDPNGLDALVGMLGGDNAEDVTIPAIFISYNSGTVIVPEVNNGAVGVCFERPTFENALGPYSYFTPQSQIIPLENMSVIVTNRDGEEKRDVECTLEITNPLGDVTTLSKVRDLPPGDTIIYNFAPYLPKELGEYNMKYTSGNDGKVIERKFEITEYTFGVDSGAPLIAVGPSAELFQTSNFFYQHANLVLTGSDGMATHITFGLGNGAELLSGDASSDLILYAIYDGDADDNGQIDNFDSFEALGDVLSIGEYQITGDETFDQLITIPLEEPIMLEAGGIYFVSIVYDGINAATGVPPSFSATSDENYFAFTTPLLLDQLYNGGWANFTLITRLHMEGFISGVNDIELLAEGSLSILSNPVRNDRLHFELNLEEPSSRIEIMFRDLNGKLINQMQFSNQAHLNQQMSTKGLPAGTYFLNVKTDEGFRSEKIMIVE